MLSEIHSKHLGQYQLGMFRPVYSDDARRIVPVEHLVIENLQTASPDDVNDLVVGALESVKAKAFAGLGCLINLNGCVLTGSNFRNSPCEGGSATSYSPCGCSFGVHAGSGSPDSLMQQSLSGSSLPACVWQTGTDFVVITF